MPPTFVAPCWRPQGTANTLQPATTQVGVFFERTAALDVTDPSVDAGDADQLKMGFSGCGVTAGLPGTLFAYGLAPQCDEVVARIQSIAAHHSIRRGRTARSTDSAGSVPSPMGGGESRRLVVNVLGLSRGAVAALMLAQRMSRLPPSLLSRLTLSLALFDPVPGNLVFTARYLDVLAAAGAPGVLTTATGVMDVSYTPIERVLALYPHEPLPWLAFHAPLLPTYPASAAVEEEAMLGCHQAAVYPPARVRGHRIAAACRLSAHRLESFLSSCGTALHPTIDAALADDDVCLRDCEAAVADSTQTTYRIAHLAGPWDGAVRRAEAGLLLNRHHLRLLACADPEEALRRVRAAAAAPSKAPLFLLSVERGPPAAVASQAEDIVREAAEALAWLERQRQCRA
jgi:hypothetical protein